VGRERRVEIAGAGLGGLTLAAALAQRGWRVRMHEQAPQLRELGVGTSVWENGCRALEAIGAFEEFRLQATPIARNEVYDERRRLMRLHHYNPAGDRGFVTLRVDLHRALVNAALRAGVEIVTSSPVAAADPDGVLVLESGERLAADLVIGCDGYYSKVRQSLGVAVETGSVTDAHIGRVTVAREPSSEDETIQEYWSGGRRIGVLSCGSRSYLFVSAPEGCPHNRDEVESRSLNKNVWIEAYPFLKDKLQQADDEVIWGRYPIVRCREWSVGRAAIVGDSAHAMPSTLAQGAGTAMTNALALAYAVQDASDIPQALRSWEQQHRPVTEITQRWAVLYAVISVRWPDNLLDLRSAIVSEAFASPNVLAHFLTAARHVVGTRDLQPQPN
jgi:2-polyprenyl-6-methoxyphenol hydroxylase-like FAD-dependent oxidoreductase